MKKTILYLVPILIFWGCVRNFNILGLPDQNTRQIDIPIESDYTPKVEKCIWRANKLAAYTIAFDDARPSHFQVSGPELSKRNMCGTFYIHTKAVVDWQDWQGLADMGHEIGSHTWSHPKMNELPELLQREELARAISDIRGHLRGAPQVPSFAYPYGLFNDQLRQVVRDYHMSARGGGGLNSFGLSDDELTAVKGIGVYPPYDMASIAGWVKKAMGQFAWIIVYFHTVSTSGDSNDTTIPLNLFLQHIDYVAGLRDSLWIATQGEVVNYIKLRRTAETVVELEKTSALRATLRNMPDGLPNSSSMTVKLWLPRNWLNETVIVEDGTSGRVVKISPAEASLLIDVPIMSNIKLSAEARTQVQ